MEGEGVVGAEASSAGRGQAGRAPSAADRAYEHLRDAILEGRIPAGEMLGESGVAEHLGMSRTPVRTALARLQDEQWVTIYPKRGALVLGLDEHEVADIADARHLLEVAAVQRAGAARIERVLPRLEESLRAQEEALEAGDLHSFIDQTTSFHRMFVEVGGNATLLEMSDRLADRRRYMLFRQGERLLQRREETIAEHRALIDALQTGDVAVFAEVLRAHLRDTHDAPLGPRPFVP